MAALVLLDLREQLAQLAQLDLQVLQETEVAGAA
jgi:hypothetical protein